MVSTTIGILNRLQSVYPLKVLLTLYNTLLLPYFMGICFRSESSIASITKEDSKNKHQHQLYCIHITFVKRNSAAENDLHVFLINMEISLN